MVEDTTDQQAVTVAQEDREAAAFVWFAGNCSMDAGPRVREMLTGLDDSHMAVQAFARHRLASVSSASAEGYKLPCDVHLPPATIVRAGCDLSTLKMAMEIGHRPRHFEGNPRESLPASPEPGPATNQAGEVAREKLQQTWDLMSSLPPLIFSESEADHLIATIAALATQPATSQEGEAPVCWRYEYRPGDEKPWRWQYSETQVTVAAANFGYVRNPMPLYAATPTPPTEAREGELKRLREYHRTVEEMVCVWRDTNNPSSMDEEAWTDPDDDDRRWEAFADARAALSAGSAGQ